MNLNFPEKRYYSETTIPLFPSEISKEDIQMQIQQAPDSVRKILSYYLLTDYEGKYEEVYLFLKCCQDKGKVPLEKLNNPVVFKILKTVRQIKRQIHKLMGLLRFHEIEGGYLYASFSSDFDILVPLTQHFMSRFPKEQLILHDTKRRKALFVEEGDIYEVFFHTLPPLETSDEKIFQRLWLQYHQSIAITSRENKKLQNQNIPIKFQQWLLEFEKRDNYKSLEDIIPLTQ